MMTHIMTPINMIINMMTELIVSVRNAISTCRRHDNPVAQGSRRCRGRGGGRGVVSCHRPIALRCSVVLDLPKGDWARTCEASSLRWSRGRRAPTYMVTLTLYNGRIHQHSFI